MKEIKGVFRDKIQRTADVISFRFNLNEKMNFIPGQFVQVIFDETDPKNKTFNKYLSFSSSPARDYIEVTKKISDSLFSEKLTSLKPGDSIIFKGPSGNCVFKDLDEKIAFIVGGIGVTPVISILEYIMDNQLTNDVILLYSNWTSGDIAFKAELKKWEETCANIKVKHVLVKSEESDTECLKGFITDKIILKSIPDLLERMIFVYGPPKMVDSMKEICQKLNCQKEKLKTETFTGY